MQSYSYQPAEEDEKEEYQQELGLRKMLYKYQHENQQLKNQIKALTERLESILSEKSRQQGSQIQKVGNSPDKMQDAHAKYLSQQMNYFFRRIEEVKADIKTSKDSIDSSKQLQYTNLSNTLKDKQSKLQSLKSKLNKFKQETNTATINADTHTNANPHSHTNGNSNQELEIKYSNQLNQLKKKIRQLEKIRNNNHKNDISRHIQLVQLGTRTRKIANGELFKHQTVVQEMSGPGKKGLWGLDLTQENYRRILEDFEQLKSQKGNLLESIKVQNNGLRERLAKLKNQYIDISSQNANLSVDISSKRLKQSAVMTPKQKLKQTIVLPDIPVPLGNSAYERKNDKNFVPKKIKLVQWNSSKGKKGNQGFSWNDQNHKSPITGINLWMNKYLIGIQFIHTLGQTIQHIHTEGGGDTKKLVPIQYRLNSNDYLENIVLVISKVNGNQQSGIVTIQGIEFQSKNGRKDIFGLKVGTQGTQKFDYGISAPEKPIYSFGSFIINSSTHLSSINSLGFAVI